MRPAADPLTDTVLLTPHEVAARLRVSTRTVVRLVKGGVMPARAVLGRMRFSWPEVLASLPPVAATRPLAEQGVAALDLNTRLRLKATHFYRNSSRKPGGAA